MLHAMIDCACTSHLTPGGAWCAHLLVRISLPCIPVSIPCRLRGGTCHELCQSLHTADVPHANSPHWTANDGYIPHLALLACTGLCQLSRFHLAPMQAVVLGVHSVYGEHSICLVWTEVSQHPNVQCSQEAYPNYGTDC